MNLWILIGIVIIVVGFSLKLDVLAVVLTAGIATGIAAKINAGYRANWVDCRTVWFGSVVI